MDLCFGFYVFMDFVFFWCGFIFSRVDAHEKKTRHGCWLQICLGLISFFGFDLNEKNVMDLGFIFFRLDLNERKHLVLVSRLPFSQSAD